MGIEKKVYSIRLYEGVADQLRQYARAENRKLSNLVETVILQYPQNLKNQTEDTPPS